jgi:hypothetical protein
LLAVDQFPFVPFQVEIVSALAVTALKTAPAMRDASRRTAHMDRIARGVRIKAPRTEHEGACDVRLSSVSMSATLGSRAACRLSD